MFMIFHGFRAQKITMENLGEHILISQKNDVGLLWKFCENLGAVWKNM
jgi:hypothetical protein